MDQDNSPQNDIRDCRDLTQSQSSDMISQKLDPVHRLPSEIIAKVVSLLGAEDTESLRSLSKHWKDFSEVLNTKQAIVQHFPRYRCPPLGTPVEHNILFRRLGMLQRTALLVQVPKLTCNSKLSSPSKMWFCDENTQVFRDR